MKMEDYIEKEKREKLERINKQERKCAVCGKQINETTAKTIESRSKKKKREVCTECGLIMGDLEMEEVKEKIIKHILPTAKKELKFRTLLRVGLVEIAQEELKTWEERQEEEAKERGEFWKDVRGAKSIKQVQEAVEKYRKKTDGTYYR